MGLFSIISTCNFVKFNDLYLIDVFTLDISFKILMCMSRFDIFYEYTNVYGQIKNFF